jgi:hypothetical protein
VESSTATAVESSPSAATTAATAAMTTPAAASGCEGRPRQRDRQHKDRQPFDVGHGHFLQRMGGLALPKLGRHNWDTQCHQRRNDLAGSVGADRSRSHGG